MNCKTDSSVSTCCVKLTITVLQTEYNMQIKHYTLYYSLEKNYSKSSALFSKHILSQTFAITYSYTNKENRSTI